jgi:hypothetical protein
VQQAIGAHGVWKAQLKAAITTGKSDKDAATVGQDNQCAFGKWLYATDATFKRSPHFEPVRKLHAEFHKCCAELIRLATSGKKNDAEAMMAPQGKWTQASTELTVKMIQWQKEL